MTVATCIDKKIQGRQVEYLLKFENGEKRWVSKEMIKKSIKQNDLKVNNMKLTSNNRLIPLKNYEEDFDEKANIQFKRLIRELYRIRKTNNDLAVLLYMTTITLGFLDIQNEAALNDVLRNNVIDMIAILNRSLRSGITVHSYEFKDFKMNNNSLIIVLKNGKTKEIKLN